MASAVRVPIPGVPAEGPVSVIIQNLQLDGGCVSSLPGEGLALDCGTKGIKSISDFSVLGHHAFQFSQVCASQTKLSGTFEITEVDHLLFEREPKNNPQSGHIVQACNPST